MPDRQTWFVAFIRGRKAGEGYLNLSFTQKAQNVLGGPLRAQEVGVLQVNLGYRCNMSCSHCHIQGGAGRLESMEPETIESVLRTLGAPAIATLDLTGGAPELHPGFRDMISSARSMGKHVIVRSNLTVLLEDGMEGLAEFFSRQGVEVSASLPCYTRDMVDRARGIGAYDRSIEAIRRLNAQGYGHNGTGLVLNLVYNPQGAVLSPAQKALETDYRRELYQREGVVFTSLYTFANMPIGRFRAFLDQSGQYDSYMKRLADSFNPCALDGVMCRGLISVGPDGALYDCDFNQSLGIELFEGLPAHISGFDLEALSGRRIMTDQHCYGCVAGQGST